MKYFYCLRGLPASGKSSWARDFAAANDNILVISKDDIRRQVVGDGKWKPKLEGEVIKIENVLIDTGMMLGKTIVSDNTNYNPKHIARYQEYCKKYDYQFELMDFNTPPEECIKRDLRRGEKAVGADVIWEMYWKWVAPAQKSYEHQNGLPAIVIFDIDGTLADLDGRNPYDRDFINDPVIEPVAYMWHKIDCQYKAIFSGRDGKFRRETLAWLARHDFVPTIFRMREEGDKRRDAIIKREFFEQEIRGKYNVFAVFDDRPQMVRMWAALGVFVFNVNQTPGFEY